jgi:nucleoside-diphosphate-sugar epimerase
LLVTGATGFVGHAVACRAAELGWAVRAAGRRAPVYPWPLGISAAVSPDLAAPDADWRALLRDVDAVVHCAARVHVMQDSVADPLAAFVAINADATAHLARQAAREGVRRFVFLSTIGIHGAETRQRPFSADDPPAPHSPYARSKLQAEQSLREIARETGLEVVVIRPPLVYGPGAPGNFARLLNAVRRGLPLPFAAVDNRRSLVGLQNLADCIVACLAHPQAPHRAFLVSDDDDLSTPELLRRVAAALGTRARLFPLPTVLLRLAARAVGRGALARQLCGSLQVDIAETRRRLDWTPPSSVDAELGRAAAALLGGGRTA